MKVAIVIPTINRPEFIGRQLKFYSDLNSEHPIYVGDSSSDEISKAFKKRIEDEFSNLVIHYYHVPELNDGQTVHHLISNVKEEYVVFIGDDDFQIPSLLSKCADYLEKNPEYQVVSGNGLLFSLDSIKGVKGKINTLQNYKVQTIKDSFGSERLLNLFRSYKPTLFGVHRTGQFLETYSRLLKVPDKRFRELLPVAIDIIKGKQKVFPEIQFLRQHHEGRYFLPGLFEWVTSEDWYISFCIVREYIIREVEKVDNINSDDAKRVAHTALKTYFNIRLNKDNQFPAYRMLIESIKKTIPYLFYRFIVNWKLKRKRTDLLKVNKDNPELSVLLNYIEEY